MTLTVRLLVNVPLAGKVALEGLKVHDNPAGSPGQLKVNWSVNPFREFMKRSGLPGLGGVAGLRGFPEASRFKGFA